MAKSPFARDHPELPALRLTSSLLRNFISDPDKAFKRANALSRNRRVLSVDLNVFSDLDVSIETLDRFYKWLAGVELHHLAVDCKGDNRHSYEKLYSLFAAVGIVVRSQDSTVEAEERNSKRPRFTASNSKLRPTSDNFVLTVRNCDDLTRVVIDEINVPLSRLVLVDCAVRLNLSRLRAKSVWIRTSDWRAPFPVIEFSNSVNEIFLLPTVPEEISVLRESCMKQQQHGQQQQRSQPLRRRSRPKGKPHRYASENEPYSVPESIVRAGNLSSVGIHPYFHGRSLVRPFFAHLRNPTVLKKVDLYWTDFSADATDSSPVNLTYFRYGGLGDVPSDGLRAIWIMPSDTFVAGNPRANSKSKIRAGEIIRRVQALGIPHLKYVPMFLTDRRVSLQRFEYDPRSVDVAPPELAVEDWGLALENVEEFKWKQNKYADEGHVVRNLPPLTNVVSAELRGQLPLVLEFFRKLRGEMLQQLKLTLEPSVVVSEDDRLGNVSDSDRTKPVGQYETVLRAAAESFPNLRRFSLENFPIPSSWTGKEIGRFRHLDYLHLQFSGKTAAACDSRMRSTSKESLAYMFNTLPRLKLSSNVAMFNLHG